MDVTSVEYNLSQNSNDKNDFALTVADSDSVESEDDQNEIDEKEFSRKLKERLLSLRATMQDLKKQLKEEKESWRKEMETAKLYTNQVDVRDKTSDDHLQIYSAHSEHQYQRYEDAINQAHKESRANLQKQIAISNYKRRLLEVENMCNMELLRVKQSVQFLQPLQLMASEWNCNKDVKSNESGDTLCEKADSSLTSITTSCSEDSKPREVTMPLEVISNKLYNDMNDMFSKLSAQYNESMPQLATGSWASENQKLHSRSSIWYECIGTKQN